MKVKRVDKDKTEKDADRIELAIGDQRYTLTEEFGRLHIHSHGEFLDVRPCCANQITVKGYYV